VAEARCGVCLFSPHIASALVQRGHIRSHTLSTRGGGTLQPSAVKQRAKRSGAQGDPHVEVSTRAPKSAAHPLRSSRVPGPKCCVDGGVDTDASTMAASCIKDARSEPFRLRQSPGGRPPLGVAVTLVFPDIARMTGGSVRTRSGRVDLQRSREPSSLRELHAGLFRQTASATATGLFRPDAIELPAS